MIGDILDFQLISIGETPVTVSTAITALLILAGSYAISRVLRGAVRRALEQRTVHGGTLAVSQRLVHYAVVLVGAAIALETLGINLSALFAAGAIFAVGIGFAMQNIAQNFVSGLILLVERSIKPGDVLEVDGTVVRVAQMGIRATLARTREDEEMIIPNATLVQSTVKNFTLRDSLFRVRATVGVTYGSDLRLVFDTLARAADGLSWRSAQRDPRVQLRQFGSSSVDMEVSVWIDDPWDAQQRLSQLNEAIWWALKAAGVVIAFPQLDVHVDPPIEESIRMLSTS